MYDLIIVGGGPSGASAGRISRKKRTFNPLNRERKISQDTSPAEESFLPMVYRAWILSSRSP